MARKISLQAPVEEAPPAPSPAPPVEASRAPALSGMAKSLQAAAAASVRDIDPRLIEDSAFRDRLEPDPESLADLISSLRERGQLIPILVSPLPSGRFRIVYGRRRLAALRQLGMVAKAFVREMDEDQSILAQGQENTYRRDLSWIEKAMFARQLLEAGKSDELVCDALNIDQKARRAGEKLTGLSRMRQVAARLAPELVEAVGPAPGIGRDRWYALAQELDKKGFPPGNQSQMVDLVLTARLEGSESDARFAKLEAEVRSLGRLAARLKTGAQQTSARYGSVQITNRAATITVRTSDDRELFRWISDHPEAALEALAEARNRSEQQQ